MEFDIARAWDVACKRITPLRNIVAVFDFLKVVEILIFAQVQYEYDSDEEIDPNAGTWEHQRRSMEMDATRVSRRLLMYEIV